MLPARMLALAAVLAACGSDLSPLPIGLEFRQELPNQCPSSDCSSYGLDCGAVISVRAFPGGSDPLMSSEAISESCVILNAASDLCSLSASGLDLGDLPVGQLIDDRGNLLIGAIMPFDLRVP